MTNLHLFAIKTPIIVDESVLLTLTDAATFDNDIILEVIFILFSNVFNLC